MIKENYFHPNGGVNLILDNKLYSTITILVEEICIIGKVVIYIEKIIKRR